MLPHHGVRRLVDRAAGSSRINVEASQPATLPRLQRRGFPARRSLCGLVLVLCLTLVTTVGAANLRATRLRCEAQTEPLGLDTPAPRLSWQLESRERGESQSAYQVLVATAEKLLAPDRADLWDSGKVASLDSLSVVYQGKPLRSGQRVYWRVRAWNRLGKPGPYSASAWFEAGLLSPSDWRARWITSPRPLPVAESQMFDDQPAPLFRKEFSLAKSIRRARLYVSGLGYYEVQLNGRRVGNHVLDPGWTSYSQRVLYSTYDVTDLLNRGDNAIGAMLGNGWFNPLPLRFWGHINLREHLTIGPPRLIAQLQVELADGTTQTIVTDESWNVADGPILRNNLYLGEVYDARRELAGWDRPGFDAAHWTRAQLAQEALGPLEAQTAPPIRVTRTLPSVKLTQPKPGVWIFDLGQNFAGWVRLRVIGEAGTRVQLRYGELLYPDGSLNGLTSVCGQIKQGGPAYRYEGVGTPKTAWQMDQYILKGGAEEVYTPRFTFHGFRYVEVTGFPGRPTLNSIEGLRLNSDVSAAGSFACSNERFNRIQQLVLWTELSNLFSVESDCPHREKFGYGGDIVAASELAIFNFDMARFYAKAVEDLADAVRPNGGFTETAPFVGISDEGLGEKSGPIGWGTAHPLLQWQLYQYYGDRRLLEAQYPATKRWIALLHERGREGILDNGISDHESLAPKPRALTGTAFYYYNVKLFARIARALGHEAEAAEADRAAARIQAAFNERFLRPGTGRYDQATQASQAFALYLGLVPAGERANALDVLVRDIQQNHQGHLTTGIFGTKYMLHALADAGRADVAYQVVDQPTFPGWGYMLERGATTLWEHWQFSDNTYSHNHPMFGSVSEWFYKALAGINPAPDACGFDKILIHPRPVEGLNWVKASHESVRGRVVSEWRREGDRFNLRVSVPVGATATVYLPARSLAQVKESGRPLDRARGVGPARLDQDEAIVQVGSGDYRFESSLSR